MSPDELLQMVNQDEGQRVEFKLESEKQADLEATYSLSGRFKIREGSFNRLMSPADVLGHAVQRGSLDFERTPVRQATLDDLSEQKVKDFLVQRLRTSVPDRPLHNLLQARRRRSVSEPEASKRMAVRRAARRDAKRLA